MRFEVNTFEDMMPSFAYQAVDGAGRLSQGTLEADHRAAALGQVKARGLLPVSVTTLEGPGAGANQAVSKMEAMRPRANFAGASGSVAG
ncbi:MAG: hypothetical protein HC898_09150 [Phycisphaerales bacterium]|nr:hypothetical protein [Phycisphaerales bacterium]